MEKIKILVLDDKRIIGDFFGFTLGYHGHEVTVVSCVISALELVQKEHFDIAFIDLVMPQMDGIEALGKIKIICPQLPVVMMSGYSVEEKRKRAEELGAITCLKKPFELEDIRQAIKLALGREI